MRARSNDAEERTALSAPLDGGWERRVAAKARRPPPKVRPPPNACRTAGVARATIDHGSSLSVAFAGGG